MAGGRGGYYDNCGRAARHGPEPPDAAPLPGGDGAPGRPRRPTPSATSGSRCSRPCRAGRPRTSTGTSSAASTPPGRSRGRRSPATSRRRGSSPTRRPRPTSRMRLTLNNWRWAGVPFYLRTGKRLPKRASEIADPVPPAADDALRGRHRGGRRRQPAGPADPAQRGGEPGLPGEDPRLAAAAPGGPDGLPLRHRLRRRRRPRPTSGSCST